MERRAHSMRIAVVVPALAVLLATGPASASSLIGGFQQSCTTNLCNAQQVGSEVTTTSAAVNPFTMQIGSSGGECLRAEVTLETDNLAMVLISPDGTVWHDDDSGSCNHCPRIEANTSVKGWYTLQVTKWDGGVSNGGFYLSFGRYNSGNMNCANATTPQAPQHDEAAKAATSPSLAGVTGP